MGTKNKIRIYQSTNLLFYVFFIFAMIVLLSLGTWLIEKFSLAENLKKISKTNHNFPRVNVLDIDSKYSNFRRVYAIGEVEDIIPIFLKPRTYKGKIGAHVLVPFKTKKNYILVNRGFILEEDIEIYVKNKTYLRKSNYIKGVIFVPPKPSKFSLKK